MEVVLGEPEALVAQLLGEHRAGDQLVVELRERPVRLLVIVLDGVKCPSAWLRFLVFLARLRPWTRARTHAVDPGSNSGRGSWFQMLGHSAEELPSRTGARRGRPTPETSACGALQSPRRSRPCSGLFA